MRIRKSLSLTQKILGSLMITALSSGCGLRLLKSPSQCFILWHRKFSTECDISKPAKKRYQNLPVPVKLPFRQIQQTAATNVRVRLYNNSEQKLKI